MRVAIVHDYLHQFGGAEKVVEKWLEMYPEAQLYTSFYLPQKFASSAHFEKARTEKRIHQTWLRFLFPTFIKFYKHLYWLYPIMMSFVQVRGYDLVLISSTYCGKNIQLLNNKKIIHYCHSPVRFLHGLVTEMDHKTINPILQKIIPFINSPLKKLDLKAVENLNKNGTIWVANSSFIQETIKQVYHTDSVVIYPPIELKKYLGITRETANIGNFYLCHGRISFHKRLDLAIQACLELGLKLKISGDSSFASELESLKKLELDFIAANPDKPTYIEFLGRTSDAQYHELLATCKAFLFPGKEDFGIAPIEVLAAGVPVIAYQAGGALEYIKDSQNGVFFAEQTTQSLQDAIQKFESLNLDTKTIKASSLEFSEENFENQISKL
jgi:glycosyltransferase involved in cell wall biosynthesis